MKIIIVKYHIFNNILRFYSFKKSRNTIYIIFKIHIWIFLDIKKKLFDKNPIIWKYVLKNLKRSLKYETVPLKCLILSKSKKTTQRLCTGNARARRVYNLGVSTPAAIPGLWCSACELCDLYRSPGETYPLWPHQAEAKRGGCARRSAPQPTPPSDR